MVAPMSARPRLLVVDDEEAILETMSFTFEEDYEVLTALSAREGLRLLEEQGPVAVVVSDQRMPEMTGVAFLAEVFARHPLTVRIILTGFADMDAILSAINEGHVYAYITKPWEPDQLKQVVRRAAEHYELARENERLVSDLRAANRFLEAVMDQLDTGALAVDADGAIRAMNRPAREYLGVSGDPRGRVLAEVLPAEVLERVAGAALELSRDAERSFKEVDLPQRLRLRISAHPLAAGQVILAREISHEPLRRRFDKIVSALAARSGELRGALGEARIELHALSEQVRSAGIASVGMSELGERARRTHTAIEHWLAVDDTLAGEDFPDAQLLLDRLRLAGARWPGPLPERVRELARSVETYYESGENPKRPIL